MRSITKIEQAVREFPAKMDDAYAVIGLESWERSYCDGMLDALKYILGMQDRSGILKTQDEIERLEKEYTDLAWYSKSVADPNLSEEESSRMKQIEKQIGYVAKGYDENESSFFEGALQAIKWVLQREDGKLYEYDPDVALEVSERNEGGPKR